MTASSAGKLSHTAAVAIRTAVQTVASGGFLAAGNAALNNYGHYLPPAWLAAVGVALTWVVSAAHNALEDHGIVGTWLRQPTLTPGAVAKVSAKAQASAAKAAAAAEAQAAKLAPASAPLVDPAIAAIEAKVDGLIAKFEGLVAGGVVQRVVQPLSGSPTPPPPPPSVAP